MDPAVTPQDLSPSHQGRALLGCSQPMTEHADLPRQAYFSKMWDASSCQPWLEVSPLAWPNFYLNCAGVKILPTQVFFFLPQGITHASESKDSLCSPTPNPSKSLKRLLPFCHLLLGRCNDGEGNGTPLQYSCLENSMDGGAWWAAVHGVTKSRTRLSDFTSTFHFPALEKEMATHSSVLAWRIPGTVEPCGLPSMGSHRVGHDWSDLAAAAAAAAPMNKALSKPWEIVTDREAWRAAVHRVAKSRTRFADWTAIKTQTNAPSLSENFSLLPSVVRFFPRCMKTPKMVFVEITQKEVGVDNSFYSSPLTPSPDPRPLTWILPSVGDSLSQLTKAIIKFSRI